MLNCVDIRVFPKRAVKNLQNLWNIFVKKAYSNLLSLVKETSVLPQCVKKVLVTERI